MQECIRFQMQVKKKIPEVLEFAAEKLINDKMKSYCGNDETAIEQFDSWCSEYVTIDKARGIIDAFNDSQMWEDNLWILQRFVSDIAENISEAEFTGSMDKFNDEIGTEITINFKMKKGELEFESVYPEDYGDDEYDEEEDYDEVEEE